MIAIAVKINNLINPLRSIAEKFLSPVLLLVIRLYMANIFFKSGMLKFNNYLDGRWENTIMMFEDFHPIPGIPAEYAAILGTGAELILPVLLAFGLFGRFGAAGLLFMTLVIQFIVPAEYEMSNPDHYYWMMLLAVPLLKGSGIISIDHALVKFITKRS